MLPLGLLIGGEKGEVVEIRVGGQKDASRSCSGQAERRGNVCRMEDIGLREGKIVEMLSNGGHGPMLIRLDESRIAIGRGMAMKIMVKKVNSEW